MRLLIVLRSLVLGLLFLYLIEGCTRKSSHAKLIFDKYENGNEKVVFQYLTDTAEMNGDHYYQEFYENGELKLQGLESGNIRKGEWKYYFEDGAIKAKMHFVNDTLNGAVILFDRNEEIIASSQVENGVLKLKDTAILGFFKKEFNLTEQRPVWLDSIFILTDSLRKVFYR